MEKAIALRKAIYLPLIVALTLGIYSCSIYKISPKEKEWVPYKAGQKIVFTSQDGKSDTIFIVKEEIHDRTAPMRLVSDVNQSLTITARVPDPFTNVGDLHFTHSYQPMIILLTKDSETIVTINLEVYGHPFASINNFKSLGKGMVMSLGGKTYDDIIIFKCNGQKECADSKAIKQLYWSRKTGLVQYTIGEEQWNLTEIIN